MQTPPRRASEDAPIFIIGDGRSGTTLVRMMISAHPNIYICHESYFYAWDAVCDPKYDGDTFLDYYFKSDPFQWLQLRKEDIMAKVGTPVYREDVHRAFLEIMKQKSAMYGRKRYGDKTPLHTFNLARMLIDFPDAYVIQMIRDPRSQVMSISQMPFGSESEAVDCLLYETSRKMLDPFKHRLLRVRLEDLLANPRHEMERILEYVGEPWDDAVLEHARHRVDPNDMPEEPWFAMAERPVENTRPRWEGQKPSQVRMIEKLCKNAMREYGYEKAELPTDASALAVWREILSDVPSGLRFMAIQGLIGALSRNPKNWGTRKLLGLYRLTNPRFWKKNPGYQRPPAPPPVGEEAVTAAASE